MPILSEEHDLFDGDHMLVRSSILSTWSQWYAYLFPNHVWSH